MKKLLLFISIVMYSNSYCQTFNIPDIPIESALDPNLDLGETSLYINPRNPAMVVSGHNAYYDYNGVPKSGNGVFFSQTNGGQSWQSAPYLSTAPFILDGSNGGYDPAIAMDYLNRIYLNYLMGGAVKLLYSDDFFQTSTSVNIITPNNNNDKTHLAIDDRPISSDIYLYSGWKNSDYEISTSYSINRGDNWSTPFNLITQSILPNGPFPTSSSLHYHQGVNLAVGPNGDAYAAWGIYDGSSSTNVTESTIGFAKTTDHGQTWTAFEILDLYITGIRNHSSGTTCGARCASWATVDVNQQNGNIYIVWTNIGEPCVAPNFAVDCNTGDADIYFMKSTDEGLTWSYPQLVNSIPNDGKAQWYSWLACDPHTGLLGVIYYGRDASNNINTYLSLSNDEGLTWSEQQINDIPFNDNNAPSAINDYIGLKINNGLIVPIWIDERTVAGNSITTAWTQPFEYPIAQDLNLCNPVTPYYEIYKAQNTITVADNSCGYEILSNSYINMYCSQHIKFSNGFHAANGSKFHAHIENIPDAFHAHEKVQSNNFKTTKLATSLTTFCYPNPFTSYTTIGITCPYITSIKIDLYDCFGRPVKNLISRNRISEGTYYFSLNKGEIGLQSGIYNCIVTTNKERKSFKIISVAE